MSEPSSRGSATRGRGGFRGGRGGYRGARGTKPHSQDHETTSLEDQGEVGELKARYADKLPLLREVCEGWADEDLVFALQETNGDEIAALDRITSGSVSQWGEVKKKTHKTKDSSVGPIDSSRGRGRGGFDARGRGRGAERGARGAAAPRGGQRAVSHTNGARVGEKSTKPADDTADATTNGHAAITQAAAAAATFANEPGKDQLASLETEQAKPAAAAAPQAKASGGWASLFAKAPAPPAPVAKKESIAPPPQAEPTDIPVAQPQDTASITATDDSSHEILPPPPIEPLQVDDGPVELPSAPHSDVATGDITPAADELTKENLKQLPDTSIPPTTETAASTAASTVPDPLKPALPPSTAIRPGMSGHAASALRATTGAGRSASYSKKVMDQQEAVVMPGNHAVDRAAVQFGKMGLDGDDVDADEDREEPETRTQLPDDSPAAPRASLPPSLPEAQPAQEAQTAIEPPTEPQALRQPAGLPSAPQAQQPAEPSPSQSSAFVDQYRYGQGQKPYDPFSQQPQHAQPSSSEPFSNQLPSQTQGPAGMSQAEYAQYYSREYAQYYQNYQQQQQQEAQRSGSAFGTSAQDTSAQYATAGPRGYGSQDLANSGNNTPNPQAASHQGQQSSHMQHAQGSHPSYPQGYGGYGAGYGTAAAYPQYNSYGSMNSAGRYGASRPMFDDVRRQEDYYSSQYGSYGHNQNYGANYKSNMYGGPQHQYSHDFSSSPGNAAFSGRDGGYGRAGSTQPSDAPQTGAASSSAFSSGMPDPFGRTPSGFGQSQHGAHGGGEDPAKPTGPSPSLQGGRPGSVNAMSAQQQAGLPHSQAGQQQGFSGYPQYGGNFGNQTGHGSGYGGYGSNNAFSGYGASGGYGRGGGWTGSYGTASQH